MYGAGHIQPLYAIAYARPQDLHLLPAIKLAATALLTDQAPESILSETTSEQDFREAQAEGRREIPIGFAHAELLGPHGVHLKEIDVHPNHGRRGLGIRLVVTVCEWAARLG